jgi:hypothetical protein
MAFQIKGPDGIEIGIGRWAIALTVIGAAIRKMKKR